MKNKNHNTIRITCLLAVCLLILFACKKEEEEVIVFEGMTTIIWDWEELSYITTETDETDWRTDDIWPSKVYQLFQHDFFVNPRPIDTDLEYPRMYFTAKAVMKSCLDDTSVLFKIEPVYPNPCTSMLYVPIYFYGRGNFQLVAIDKDFKVYIRYRKKCAEDGEATTIFLIRTEFKKDELYRLYYRFLPDSGTEYLGHGDFMKVDEQN